MINEIFDFEKEIAINLNIDKKTLIANGLARFFRSLLLNRWDILNKYNTYPNMINKLKI